MVVSLLCIVLLGIVFAFRGKSPEPMYEVKEDTVVIEDTIADTLHPVTPVVYQQTDDELFAKAKTLSEYKSLADKGYTKAYYPLAEKYYENKSYTNATEWAKKSVNEKQNVQKSKALISKIEKVQNDALFAKAKTIKEYKALADKGYTKAYAPLAKLYFDKKQYVNANRYATKAINADVGRDTAVSIVVLLDKLGFYDDKSEVKPNV